MSQEKRRPSTKGADEFRGRCQALGWMPAVKIITHSCFLLLLGVIADAVNDAGDAKRMRMSRLCSRRKNYIADKVTCELGCL